MLHDEFYEGFPSGNLDHDHLRVMQLRDRNPRDFLFTRLRLRPDVVVIRSATPKTENSRKVSVPAKNRKIDFALHASPERRRPGVQHKCSRIGIYDEGGQRAWLCRMGELHGFTVNEVEVQSAPMSFPRVRDDRVDVISLVDAWFRGNLTVVDRQRFAEALRTGIGRRAAYGFGMLLFS